MEDTKNRKLVNKKKIAELDYTNMKMMEYYNFLKENVLIY